MIYCIKSTIINYTIIKIKIIKNNNFTKKNFQNPRGLKYIKKYL